VRTALLSVLTVWLVALLAVHVLFSYPCGGWSERLTGGQRPPYHWRQDDTSAYISGSMSEAYVGANGEICATAYHYESSMSGWNMYGWGFSKQGVSREEAEREARRWCR
jgi:hypothetical protein